MVSNFLYKIFIRRKRQFKLTLTPELFAPVNIPDKHTHSTDMVWLQPVKLNPIRHKPGPRNESNANDFRITPLGTIWLLVK